MTDEYEDLEARWSARLEGLRAFLKEHDRPLIGTAIAAVFGTWMGVFNPSWPDWWPIVPVMGVAALVAGYFASEKIYALIPEEPTVLIVTLRGDEPGGEIYELSEDEFGDMFCWGDLYQWPQTKQPVYEARAYDAESNCAVGNWRESMPASAFLSEQDVEDAMTAVRELRQDLEPEAAKAKELRRRFRGIARKIDAERTKERFREIDATSLDKDTEGATIGEILDESVPAEVHPDAGMGEQGAIARPVATATNGHHAPDEQTDDRGESGHEGAASDSESDTTEDATDE